MSTIKKIKMLLKLLKFHQEAIKKHEEALSVILIDMYQMMDEIDNDKTNPRAKPASRKKRIDSKCVYAAASSVEKLLKNGR